MVDGEAIGVVTVCTDGRISVGEKVCVGETSMFYTKPSDTDFLATRRLV